MPKDEQPTDGTSMVGSILFWLVFTLFLSLLQAWVLVGISLAGIGDIDLRRLLTDGSIIFFANALTMKAIEDKCSFLALLARKKDKRIFKFLKAVGIRIGGGAVILVTSVILYCVLLWESAKLPAGKTTAATVEGVELCLLSMALLVSLYETIDNDKRRNEDMSKTPMQQEGESQ